MGGSLTGKTIAVLGLTFKANTDDTRESPAIAVIEQLVSRGGKVMAYDPMVTKYNLTGMSLTDSAATAAAGADAGASTPSDAGGGASPSAEPSAASPSSSASSASACAPSCACH